jgi:hypothetical protein
LTGSASSSSSASPSSSASTSSSSSSSLSAPNENGPGCDEEEDEEEDGMALSRPMQLDFQLGDQPEEIHLFGFLEKDQTNRKSLAYTALSTVFGDMADYDPAYTPLKSHQVAAIMQGLKAEPKDWVRAELQRSSYRSNIEILAHRVQISLRSMQDAILGMFHALEVGNNDQLIQLMVDAYALTAHTASECQDARIQAAIPGLSRALEHTDRSALLTPGVEKRIEDAGMEDSFINQFFQGRGRGYSPTSSRRWRGRNYRRGGGWGRGSYNNTYGYQPRGWNGQGWNQPWNNGWNTGWNNQWAGRRAYTPPPSWGCGYRGQSNTPPPGRGFRGRRRG